ncbi:hypothetical protein N7527_009876 [Penicillium freii]|nr:hypothetical protein N7527_009876 [Penicillium freii]
MNWSRTIYVMIIHPGRIRHQLPRKIPSLAPQKQLKNLRLNQYDPTTQRFKEGLAKLAKGARHARYKASRRYIQITGIINANQCKEIKRKEYKLTEKADQEKTRRKWKKVLVEIRKHGRAKKRRGDL